MSSVPVVIFSEFHPGHVSSIIPWPLSYVLRNCKAFPRTRSTFRIGTIHSDFHCIRKCQCCRIMPPFPSPPLYDSFTSSLTLVRAQLVAVCCVAWQMSSSPLHLLCLCLSLFLLVCSLTYVRHALQYTNTHHGSQFSLLTAFSIEVLVTIDFGRFEFHVPPMFRSIYTCCLQWPVMSRSHLFLYIPQILWISLVHARVWWIKFAIW